MYSKIMIPVDLRHLDDLQKALATGAALAKCFDATVTYVSVTTEQPSSLARSPAEFQQKLDAFAAAQASAHGISANAHGITSHDPAADLDHSLLAAVKTLGADLVVMQSHLPTLVDFIWPSNGGTIASRSDVSVLVVRGS